MGFLEVPGSCSAIDQPTSCNDTYTCCTCKQDTGQCSSNQECNDGNDCTTDTCTNAGQPNSVCSNVANSYSSDCSAPFGTCIADGIKTCSNGSYGSCVATDPRTCDGSTTCTGSTATGTCGTTCPGTNTGTCDGSDTCTGSTATGTCGTTCPGTKSPDYGSCTAAATCEGS
ncbi:MAG: hypothetical protein Q8P53_00215, partial [Candidatus Shapirobacteria bacterium]|nr:hypothetical protein [Candidatus Shapirobacteria bacterium]